MAAGVGSVQSAEQGERGVELLPAGQFFRPGAAPGLIPRSRVRVGEGGCERGLPRAEVTTRDAAFDPDRPHVVVTAATADEGVRPANPVATRRRDNQQVPRAIAGRAGVSAWSGCSGRVGTWGWEPNGWMSAVLSEPLVRRKLRSPRAVGGRLTAPGPRVTRPSPGRRLRVCLVRLEGVIARTAATRHQRPDRRAACTPAQRRARRSPGRSSTAIDPDDRRSARRR
jgi:hypothetical protein